ncbi:glycoside hydrolase family 13 protein, partial [bacterium]|nr:glycoside hydrolase family 13 protein [bacterium]
MTPDWVRRSVFYMILPDRFSGKNMKSGGWDTRVFEPWDAPPGLRAYKGGNIPGIRSKLDYLSDLGITALYLTPIFSSPTYHRYKPIDFYAVDRLLGGNKEFKLLLNECQQRNIHVILDAVFNHVGIAFPPFQDVIEYGAASPWKNWFHIESFPVNPYEGLKPRNFRGWNGNRTMPELNHSNPAVREFVIRVAEHWVRRGIDGWRFDHPQNMNTPGFWEEMRSRLKHINPNVYLVGELWTDASPWLNGKQWDAVMNYPLMGAIHRFAAAGRMRNEHLLKEAQNQPVLNAAEFAFHVESLINKMPYEIQLAQFNFINTHDLARFITVASDDRASVELATILLFTLPGAPAILYGDEVGLAGGLPPDSRRGFPTEDKWDQSCLNFHKQIIQLRHSHDALQKGSYKTLHAEGMMFAMERHFKNEVTLTAINAGDQPDRIKISDSYLNPQVLFGSGKIETHPDGCLQLHMPA